MVPAEPTPMTAEANVVPPEPATNPAVAANPVVELKVPARRPAKPKKNKDKDKDKEKKEESCCRGRPLAAAEEPETKPEPSPIVAAVFEGMDVGKGASTLAQGMRSSYLECRKLSPQLWER